MHRPRSLHGALVALLVAGCSSSDNPATPPGDSGNGGGNGGGRVVVDDPSFSAVVQEIFERKGCNISSCHGLAEEGDLDLTRGSAFSNLVGVQAVAEPGVRVITGDATGSYLVIKLEGRQSSGSSMPLSGSPLDAIDLANVKNWINQGAKNN